MYTAACPRRSAKAPYRYRIKDHAVRFWYRFVHPNRSRLELAAAAVWATQVAPNLDPDTGGVFEDIARAAFRRHHAA